MKLGFAGKRTQGYGWGVCCTELYAALARQADLVDVFHEQFPPTLYDFPVFVPLVDHHLNPCCMARGKLNLGYAFLERAVGESAVANAQRYEIVYAGSSWAAETMMRAGIVNGRVLVQGVMWRS